MDVEVEIYFAARSVLLLQPQVADRLHASSDPRKSIYGYMREAAALGTRFYACPDALAAHGMDARAEALIPEYAGPAGAVSFMVRMLDPEWRTLTY